MRAMNVQEVQVFKDHLREQVDTYPKNLELQALYKHLCAILRDTPENHMEILKKYSIW